VISTVRIDYYRLPTIGVATGALRGRCKLLCRNELPGFATLIMRERFPLYARSSNVDTQFMRELVASLCVEIHELAQMPLEIVEKPLVSWIFNPLRLRGVRTSY
jgi:hypothetical protein